METTPASYGAKQRTWEIASASSRAFASAAASAAAAAASRFRCSETAADACAATEAALASNAAPAIVFVNRCIEFNADVAAACSIDVSSDDASLSANKAASALFKAFRDARAAGAAVRGGATPPAAAVLEGCCIFTPLYPSPA